ncbi:MAG: hypothetical protein QXR48_02870 [Candidatus Woesearchaeota archaeon]
MPYVKKDVRKFIDPALKPALEVIGKSEIGDVNYVITRILWKYLQEKGINYSNLNNVVGVLECAKLELYRRVVAPYEEKKKKMNGEVYK